MYEPSFISSHTITTYAKKMVHNGQPNINIVLDQHNDIPFTYTTSDSLSGQISITSPQNVRFDDVQITLEGITSTYVEVMTPVAAQSKIKARHPFLKLEMPIAESDYPQPRIAEAGETYRFPFHFVIPEHLLLSACKHGTVADHVHHAHLRLPPSMGDADISPRDDMSPEMAKVQYAIRVRVTRIREHDGRLVTLAEHHRKLRVLPTIPEAPPMHISADDKSYAMCVTKSLRKGMFAGKIGKITVSASQTKALTVSPSSSTPPTIMATLKLRFDPADRNSQAPRLGSLASKITALSFYAVKPLKDLANRGSMLSTYETTRGVYSTCIPLASRRVESVPWAFHPASSELCIRRDSGYSTCSDDSSSTVTPTFGWYSASILVPLILPACKTWLPSFHSCMASRIYMLDMTLSVHTPGTGVPSSNIVLKLPIQISSGPEAGMPHTIAPAAEAEIEEFFRPRLLSVPNVDFVRNGIVTSQDGGMEGPPGYA